MNIIESIKEKCKLCYACIRACPAKAIKIDDEHAKVVHDRCVGCGSCLNVCAPEALIYNSSKEFVKELLRSEDKVVAIVGPSISGEFVDIKDYRHFVSMIRQLGFDYVNEISFGVDLVAHKYLELIDNFQGKYYITTKCPVVVSFVEKFHPDLVDNLAPIATPVVAIAKVVHELYGNDVKIVYIGPCVAQKHEIKLFGGDAKVDSALTFVELRELFDEFGITEGGVEYVEFDPPLGGKGALFPLRRGMFQSVGINEDLLSGRIIITDGKDNFQKALREFEKINEINQHFDLFYCEGCIMGPGMSSNGNKFKRRTKVLEYVKKRLENFDEVEWKKSFDKYFQLDLSRKYNKEDFRLPEPTEEQVQKVLKALGKETREDQTGCGACGYESCKEFSVAICQGLANFEMCHTFSIQNMNRYIKKLNDANKKLSETQAALRESEQRARKEHQSAKEASETISAMMHKIHSGVVVVDESLKIIESNKSFIKMLGSDAEIIADMIPGLVGADLTTLVPFYKLFSTVLATGEDILNRDVYLGKDLINISVFTIKKNKTVGAIVRDMYAPDVRKDEVVARSREVIRENLETVQQIAFLLGESAAKTEKMLSSIITSHKTGGPEL